MRKAILALLAALPLSVMAAYVDYTLTFTENWEKKLTAGYYYMLISEDAFYKSAMATLLASGSANLDTIDRSAILAEGKTTSTTVNLHSATPIEQGHPDSYFVLFADAGFGIETYYALSNKMYPSLEEPVGSASISSYSGPIAVNYSIPEPTSGLLVLVGASLLALKRRRA